MNVAITAYVLTVAVLIPISGWLTDRFGARGSSTTAVAIFTLASVGCAVATSLPMLTVTRVLQGVGGALMVPVGRRGSFGRSRFTAYNSAAFADVEPGRMPSTNTLMSTI